MSEQVFAFIIKIVKLMNMVCEDAPYHTSTGNSVKSPKPIDGQAALDNSYLISSDSPRRVGFSNDQLVVLDRTQIKIIDGKEVSLYHGHVRKFSDLTEKMKNIARKYFRFRK